MCRKHSRCSCRLCLAIYVALLSTFYQLGLLYQSGFAAFDYDVVPFPRKARRLLSNDMLLPYVKLSTSELEEYDRNGFVVVRGAFPRDVIKELFLAAQEIFPKRQGSDFASWNDTWFLKARNVWMDADEFADFIFHPSTPIGGVAAQLLNATSIRMGNEALNGISAGQKGTGWHKDVQNNFRSGQSGRNVPVMRFWLPLSDHDIVANETGGSLSLLSLVDSASLAREFGECFFESGREMRIFQKCRARVEELMTTPDFALGDMAIYSALVAHKTQKVIQNTRLGYLGSLYDPEKIESWLEDELVPTLIPEVYYRDNHSMRFDKLCLIRASCWDVTRKECHHNPSWQSASTMGVSKTTSACFPQIYPSPLQEEVETRYRGLLLNFNGQKRVLWRWLLYSFPIFRALVTCVFACLTTVCSW